MISALRHSSQRTARQRVSTRLDATSNFSEATPCFAWQGRASQHRAAHCIATIQFAPLHTASQRASRHGFSTRRTDLPRPASPLVAELRTAAQGTSARGNATINLPAQRAARPGIAMRRAAPRGEATPSNATIDFRRATPPSIAPLCGSGQRAAGQRSAPQRNATIGTNQ
jgi:hypothetical protein